VERLVTILLGTVRLPRAAEVFRLRISALPESRNAENARAWLTTLAQVSCSFKLRS
jgi:hypothetical protein